MVFLDLEGRERAIKVQMSGGERFFVTQQISALNCRGSVTHAAVVHGKASKPA